MTKAIEIKGLAEVFRGLDKGNAKLGRAWQRGVKKAGLLLQRESQKIVPVGGWDPIISPKPGGNLKNSAFTRAEGLGFDTNVLVGYTASYAIFVHEIETAPSGRPVRHAPGKSAKFIERPARTHRRRIVKMVVDETSKAL